MRPSDIILSLKAQTALIADKIRDSKQAKNAHVFYDSFGVMLQDTRIAIQKNYADVKSFLDSIPERKKQPKN